MKIQKKPKAKPPKVKVKLHLKKVARVCSLVLRSNTLQWCCGGGAVAYWKGFCECSLPLLILHLTCNYQQKFYFDYLIIFFTCFWKKNLLECKKKKKEKKKKNQTYWLKVECCGNQAGLQGECLEELNSEILRTTMGAKDEENVWKMQLRKAVVSPSA